MIIAVGSDKGAPGVTTLAAMLARVWSGQRLLLELDPRGADLPLRLTRPDGAAMLPSPSLVSLALAVRGSGPAPAFEGFAQPTAQGFPAVVGEMSTRAYAKIVPHLPELVRAAQAWPGAVLADVGSLQTTNPALAAAQAASCVLTVIRPTLEGFAHLRDNLASLGETVADPRRGGAHLGVVVVAPDRDSRTVGRQTASLLEQIGSPAHLVGVLAFDPEAAELLFRDPGSKKLSRSALHRSATQLASRITGLWPELAPPAAAYPAGAPSASFVGREVTA